MGYLHFDTITSQSSKRTGYPSGDVVLTERDRISTIKIVCDGIGSGIKANVAANMCASRIRELILSGFTIRQIFTKVVKTMQEAKVNDLPYSAFTIIRILNDGIGTILTYEMPPSIFLSKTYATLLDTRTYTDDNISVTESNFTIKPGESIITVSDGITSAGIGNGYREGWGSEALTKFLNDNLNKFKRGFSIPEMVLNKSRELWQNKLGDDLTASQLFCRKGRIVNILTGPPSDPEKDYEVVNNFLKTEGLKFICGATTAQIVARETGKVLKMDDRFSSLLAPPNYKIDNIELVTEGAVTLNHAYNIWDEDSDKYEKNSPVTDLVSLLAVADRVNIFMGGAKNLAEDDISFAQNGIISRKLIIPLLADKLRKDGKLVVVEEV